MARTTIRAVVALLALLALNAALTFGNAWPTAWPKPAAALSVEALLLAVVLAVTAGGGGRLRRRRAVAGFAAVTAVLVLLHYLDVTLPALFGRPLSLYWDGRHLPEVLRLALARTPTGQSAAVVAGAGAGAVLLLLAAAGLGRLWLAGLDPLPGRARRGVVAGLAAAAAAGLAVLVPTVGPDDGGPLAAAQRRLVEPVASRLWGQIAFALDARSPAAADRKLPSGPRFAGTADALAGADVVLVFLESYGAVTWDDPALAGRLAERRAAFADGVRAGGRHVVSAFVRSPTFGGGSWLAHGTLLSGLDLGDPARYALLMTTARPTLVTYLSELGYRTTGLMPGLRSDWAESAFYRFDRLLDARRIDYRGPDFGFWRIPDQAAIAHWLELRRREADGPPQFLFFPTITSHIPFVPIPPYQPDWTRFAAAGTPAAGAAPSPYRQDAVDAALARPASWADPLPAYADAMDYSLQWLTGLLAQPTPRDLLLILIGDHQPAARVSGRNAPWDVPVHVVTSSAELAARLVADGFRAGLEPARPTLGPMHDLTAVLLRALAAH